MATTRTLSVANVTGGEAGALTFTLTLSAAAAQGVTVHYGTRDGNAEPGVDYVPIFGAVLIPAGQTSVTLTVPVLTDALDEDDETFKLYLEHAVGATLTTAEAVGTITDDDMTPSLSIADVTGSEGTPLIHIEVTLSAVSGREVRVDYATAETTPPQARNAIDIVNTTGTLVFEPGEVKKTVPLRPIDDPRDEPTEAFLVGLSNPVNATLAKATSMSSITDNDPTPTISISDGYVSEGEPGALQMNFQVTVIGESDGPISVVATTADGTAVAVSDYGTTSTVLPLTASSPATFSVPIVQDALAETNETFLVNLSAPVNATIARGQATGHIANDDGAGPQLVPSSTSVMEGNANGGTLVFTVVLTPAAAQPVTVDWVSEHATTTAQDFVETRGRLTFAPGVTSQTINVAVVGDTFGETNETMRLRFFDAVGARLSSSFADGTIQNDDSVISQPGLSIGNVSVQEGTSGWRPAVLPLSLSQPSQNLIEVTYTTTNGSTTRIASSTGRTWLLPGQTSGSIPIPVAGNRHIGSSETVNVAITATNVQVTDSTGALTINDDDGRPELNVEDAALIEGNSGTRVMRFRVTLSAPTSLFVSVYFALAPGTATSSSDYDVTGGPFVFAPGEQLKVMNVLIFGDTVNEGLERFRFEVTAVSTEATLGRGIAYGYIIDDDATEPSVLLTRGVGTESSNSVASFYATLTKPAALPVLLPFTITPQTAAMADFTGVLADSITVAPGQLLARYDLPLADDMLDEDLETFTITPSAPVNAVNGAVDVIGWLVDDDAAPVVSVAPAMQTEGTTQSVVVSLSTASGRDVQVVTTALDDVATSWPAIAARDFTATSVVTVIPAGSTTAQLSVPTTSDTYREGNETYRVELSAPSGATLGTASAAVTIVDDDAVPNVVVGSISAPEGDGNRVTPLVFTVTLSNPSATEVSVAYSTGGGTATAGTDYFATTGRLVFAPGQVSRTVTVLVAADDTTEATETFALTLSAPTGANLLTASATGTITNDD